MKYYYIVQKWYPREKIWYMTNIFEEKETALKMALYFTEKSKERHRVCEMQIRDIIADYT